MKYIPIMALLFFMNLQLAYCPNLNEIEKPFYIAISSPIIKAPVYTADYAPLIDAIFTFETHRDTLAINKIEQAFGGLQIRQCRIDHFNKLTGKNYTLTDMYDFTKAKEVFLYFTNHNSRGKLITPKSYEQAARNWNGSGDKTIAYWKAIEHLMQT